MTWQARRSSRHKYVFAIGALVLAMVLVAFRNKSGAPANWRSSTFAGAEERR